MKTILLKFAGPLQSWGTSSHFETRHTDFYPSKSAVIGLIGGSLGYRRNEDEKIQKLNELDFAVRIDQEGNLLRDYHTAKTYKKTGKNIGEVDRTYVTNRYYLEDAIFVVAISSDNDEVVDEIVLALENPYFQPYMGRRSLPLVADFIIEVVDDGPIESLKKLEWQAQDWYKKNHKNLLTIYADADLLGGEKTNLRKDRVRSFSQKSREFSFRYEARTEVYVDDNNENKTEHDAFDALGD